MWELTLTAESSRGCITDTIHRCQERAREVLSGMILIVSNLIEVYAASERDTSDAEGHCQ